MTAPPWGDAPPRLAGARRPQSQRRRGRVRGPVPPRPAVLTFSVSRSFTVGNGVRVDILLHSGGRAARDGGGRAHTHTHGPPGRAARLLGDGGRREPP